MSEGKVTQKELKEGLTLNETSIGGGVKEGSPGNVPLRGQPRVAVKAVGYAIKPLNHRLPCLAAAVVP